MLRNAMRAAILLLAGITAATLFATPANAKPVKPRVNEGMIALTERVCGSASTWKDEARRNGVTASSGYMIYLGRSYDITCDRSTTPARTKARTSSGSSRVDKVIAYAKAQVGERYSWGAAGPNRWDCSGLVMKSYAQIGIKLPHYSGAMLNYGRKVSRSQLRPGDIVWPHFGHVQIYIGNGYVVEAANPRTGVVIRKMWGFWTARRLL